MPALHQTYVTQVENDLCPLERTAVTFLDAYSPVAAQISQMAVIGLQDKVSKSKLNTQIQQTFGVNKRHANGLIAFAQGEVASAEACRQRHIDTLEAKVKGCKEDIAKTEKRLKDHRAYSKAVEAYNKAIKVGTKPKKLPVPAFDLACPLNGKGRGKTYLQTAKFSLHQKKRKLANLEHRLRTVKQTPVVVNQGKLGDISFVGSTGESSGNQVCQLQPGIIPVLQIRVPYFLEAQFGKFIDLPLHKFNEVGRAGIMSAWALNQAITYVFTKNKKEKWVVAVTVKVDFAVKSNPRSEGVFGLDINPGSIGWCSTDQHGNPIAFGNIKTDLHSCSTGQTEARLAEAVTEITSRAMAMNKPIAIEKLDFSEKKKNMKQGRKYRRMLSGFAYAKFVELLKARCLKLGIRVIEVSPRYSSQIGVSKYMKRYGMGSDSAAALVIARRGMGIYFEHLPARYAFQKDGSVMVTSPRKHVFAHWQTFNGRYKLVPTRNDWFNAAILTGLLGNSSSDTGATAVAAVKSGSKAQKKKGAIPCPVRWV